MVQINTLIIGPYYQGLLDNTQGLRRRHTSCMIQQVFVVFVGLAFFFCLIHTFHKSQNILKIRIRYIQNFDLSLSLSMLHLGTILDNLVKLFLFSLNGIHSEYTKFDTIFRIFQNISEYFRIFQNISLLIPSKSFPISEHNSLMNYEIHLAPEKRTYQNQLVKFSTLR